MMKTKIPLIIAAVIVFSLAGMAGATLVNSNSIVKDDIEYYVQTDKAVYILGENVEMLYKVTNLSDVTVTFSFGQTPEWQFWVTKDEMPFWIAVRGWWLIPSGFSLGPGDSRQFPTSNPPCIWDMRDMEDNLVNEGVYDVTGGLYAGTGEYDDTRVSVPITIIPEPSSLILFIGSLTMVNYFTRKRRI